MRSVLVCEAGSEAHGQERSDLRAKMSKRKRERSLEEPRPGMDFCYGEAEQRRKPTLFCGDG